MNMPKQYSIKLSFTNLDENLNTPHQVQLVFPEVYADNYEHAVLLAKRLEKTHGADDYKVILVG